MTISAAMALANLFRVKQINGHARLIVTVISAQYGVGDMVQAIARYAILRRRTFPVLAIRLAKLNYSNPWSFTSASKARSVSSY